MRAGYGVKIAGEMEVHILHRHDLGIAAARRAALHPEIRAERSFPDADTCVLADPVQAVAQTHGCGGLAFARRGRVDRGDKDQLTILAVLNRVDEILAHLGLVMTERQQVICRDPQFCADGLDRLFVRFARNLDVGFVAHWLRLSPDIPVPARRYTAPYLGDWHRTPPDSDIFSSRNGARGCNRRGSETCGAIPLRMFPTRLPASRFAVVRLWRPVWRGCCGKTRLPDAPRPPHCA